MVKHLVGMKIPSKFMVGSWGISFMVIVMVVVAEKPQAQEGSKGGGVKADDDVTGGGVDTVADVTGRGLDSADDVAVGSVGRMIVGTEEGWKKGRVEEQQLVASAKHNNYDIQIHSNAEVPCKREDETSEDDILVFLPRAEGIVAAPSEILKKALQETDADILLPSANINAMVGKSRAVYAAAKALGVTSLSALAQQLHASPELSSKHNVKINVGSVFHILDDFSSIGNQGLEMVENEDQYELQFNGQAPCIILALPESAHARALLLAISDYLVGTHRPKQGCVSCLSIDEQFTLNMTHHVMVAIFITKPQPFLEETLTQVLGHGLESRNTHFFIYNQVEKYKSNVDMFAKHLRKKGDVRNITLLQASGTSMDVGNVKNMAMRECLRLGCKWYINLDSYTFVNPQVIGVLMSLGHPVVAPTFRVQTSMQGSFWREIDSVSSSPAYSWDHANILDNESAMRGYWHASCLRGCYAVRHDVLARLTEPYTHSHKVPSTHPHPDPDLAFCSALREEGIPMIATSAFPNSGIFLNISHYIMTDNNIGEYISNSVMWRLAYIHQDLQSVLNGNVTHVKRPCHEVYEFPVFNPIFGFDLIQIAKQVNKWSPGLKEDPRKEHGIEPVPTVDQWFSQLGLEDLIQSLSQRIFQFLQRCAYPTQNVSRVKQALIARFQPDEIPGLPRHHDSSIVTFYINLTPNDEYKGGEVEFPVQECRVKAEVGHLLVFPGRLTHPKVLHNVTEGVLHKIMMYTEEPDADGEKLPGNSY